MVQKLSKDLYFEIDQIDQQIQRLKKRMDSNNNLSAENQNPNSLSLSGVFNHNNASNMYHDPIKCEVRDLRATLDSVITMVNQKSNIQDVCALVDVKANFSDTEKMI